jgi:hypothetical protein
MKNILTIAATATILSAFAGAVQAQTVTFGGSVTSSCTVTTPTTGALTALPATGPATSLSGTSTATVVCNDTAKTLNVAAAAAGNTLQNGTAAVALANGGTGNFVTASGSSKAIAAVTPLAGDTTNISAAINAPTGGLLASGVYTLVVNATITP